MLARASISRNWKRRRRCKICTLQATFHSSIHMPLSDVASWNISITHNVRKGDLSTACQLFDRMPQRTVVSWNVLISGYTKCGRPEEALRVVSKMHCSGIKLNETSLTSALSACSWLKSLDHGKQLHCLVLKSGHEDFKLVGSSLLSFYSSCFKIDEMRRTFDILHGRNPLLWSLTLLGYVRCNVMKDALYVFMQMPTRDVVSWTGVISGYSKNDGECKKSLEFFHLMMASGEANPNEFTFDSVVRACGRLGTLVTGKTIHGLLIRFGFESDQSIGGALIEFYCKCNAVEDAKRAHVELIEPCLTASNLLIEGLVSAGMIKDAEVIFHRMLERNPVSYNLMIKGYGQCGRIKDAKILFSEMPERTVVSSNTIISLYCQIGLLDEALQLFESMKWEKDTITWNSMISGYVQNDQAEEALKLYASMQREGIEHNRSTFSTLICACSGIGALQRGQALHAHVTKTPFETNVYVGTSLVDMYAKCGNITDAQTSFSNISSPNVAAWTALINGYAHHGLGLKAITLFQEMLLKGIEPNAVTFVALLTACGRAGLVSQGMQFFQSMKRYGLAPTPEHYACMVNLLGRSGNLREAEEFINGMPIEADGVVWGALLSAAWFFMDLEVGKRVAERMHCLEPKQISTYVIMSNIYAGLGRWEEVVRVRKKLRSMEVQKDPGCSWIEVKNTVHVFRVEDRDHPHCNKVYAVVDKLLANASSNFVFDHEINEIQKYDFFSFACC